ncbi:hypothetical protein FPZ43_11410 [Mucilaginibacter pallidiroseus]|uniref:Asl1-like glycosyl hydrolase catalytic domain-containing protein n=1 Tax=Mucilaginibacter pallidiroseus TaxID=2599295 RepID=A0A563UBX2_9SPHI|nr:glycosyl hydrolase [Mucilaginibacter pallidiroseus]TWR28871.1 hypothetical protein FPZ43_11410 [Mucilaginibacter pallidiroseus]
MISNYAKSLVAVACAAGLLFTSCRKQDDFLPESATSENRKLSAVNETLQSSLSIASSSSLMLGVNGHPFGDAPYLATSAAKQVELIKGMNMNWYRINVLTTSDGTISASSSSLFSSLQKAAASGAVNLLPMLNPRTLTFNDKPSVAYQKGKTLGANFAAKYGQYFSYYNLGNDLELDLLMSGTTGREVTHYDVNKSAITTAYLKGMDEGIKLKDPGAKTIIDAGWLHWGFLTLCKNNNVKFDAIGYHWYSDMEGPASRAPYNIPDISVTLANSFPDKEIWFTEFGYRYKATSTDNEADQQEFMTKFVNKIKTNPRVKVAIAYQLFDEPYKKGHESNYGFYKWSLPYTIFVKKLVAQSFAKLFTPDGGETTPSEPSKPATDLFTNLIGYSSVKPQTSRLVTDATYYTDRNYKIKTLPSYLIKSSFIKVANDDKTNKLNTYLSFTLNRATTVFIAYDPRAKTLPTWLQGFTKVKETLGTDDPKLATMDLYKKDFAAGKVNIGGNLSGSATGALYQYLLIFNEK